jgi:hypothetical protein
VVGTAVNVVNFCTENHHHSPKFITTTNIDFCSKRLAIQVQASRHAILSALGVANGVIFHL